MTLTNEPPQYNPLDCAYAYGAPPAHGKIRCEIDDFIVDERLGFAFSGEGEHLYLRIEKRGENSEWVAKQLARYAEISKRDVGYAGNKDRYAKTTQWYSVQLPGREAPNWDDFESDTIRILESHRHRGKLKTGALKGNHFVITIRQLSVSSNLLNERLVQIGNCGVPNSFGPQRFGHSGQNIPRAIEMLSGRRRIRDRHQRGIFLSAARSFLFNKILSERVVNQNWNRALSGDTMMLDGSKRFFETETIDETLQQRVESLDIHPTGALWGDSPNMVSGEVLTLEKIVADRYPELSLGLENARVASARRSLRLLPTELKWDFPAKDRMVVSFFLPAGGYATTVLRELVNLN